MAQSVSAGALPAEMRPVEDPADNLQALCLALGAGVALDGVVAPVVAVQVQGAMLAEAEVVYPERAIVQQGVGFALDHLGHAQVHSQGSLLRDQRGHVGGRHGQADRLVCSNAQGLQCLAGQAQVFAGNRGKPAVMQFMQGHLQHPAAVGRQRGGRGVVGGRWWAAAQDRVGVLGAFTTAQPAAVYTKQVGHFVETRQRNTALEPVVDVLGCDAALGGEIGRGQATFVKQGFEAVTGCVHGRECSGRVPVRI